MSIQALEFAGDPVLRQETDILLRRFPAEAMMDIESGKSPDEVFEIVGSQPLYVIDGYFPNAPSRNERIRAIADLLFGYIGYRGQLGN